MFALIICTAGLFGSCKELEYYYYPTKEQCETEKVTLYIRQGKESFHYVVCQPTE